MKKTIQTLVLLLATQMVFAQFPCQSAFTYNYDGTSLLYLNDLSFNLDSTSINVVNNTWTISGGGLVLTATGANPVVQVGSNPGWVNVCQTITTTSGCTSTYCDTLFLGTTTTSCEANFSYTEGGVLNPYFVQFNDLSTSGSPALPVSSWNWEFTTILGNVIFTSSDQNPSFTFPPVNGLYFICLTITADSCSSTSCQNVIVGDSIVVPCNLTVTPQIYNVSVTGASDGMIDLSVSGGSSPYSFSWSTGAITEDIEGLSSGVYTLVINQSNSACPAQTFTFQILEPYQIPPIDTLLTNAIDSCLGFTVDTFFVSGIVIVGNTVNVTWVFMGSGMTASFVANYGFTAYGGYMVALSFNCTKSLNNFMTYINVSQHLGLPESVTNRLMVYPNPASGHATLVLPHGQTQATLRVFNATGSLVETKNLTSGTHMLDVSDWTPGLYFLRIEGPGEKTVTTTLLRK